MPALFARLTLSLPRQPSQPVAEQCARRCLVVQDAYGAGAANGSGAAAYASGSYQNTGMTGKPVNTDGFMSTADYRRAHDISAQGDHVPDPLQTFESVGFPPDILEEVRARVGAAAPPCIWQWRQPHGTLRQTQACAG